MINLNPFGKGSATLLLLVLGGGGGILNWDDIIGGEIMGGGTENGDIVGGEIIGGGTEKLGGGTLKSM